MTASAIWYAFLPRAVKGRADSIKADDLKNLTNAKESSIRENGIFYSGDSANSNRLYRRRS